MSERKKQIEEAARQAANRMEADSHGFVKGAEWADANPPAPSESDERDAEESERPHAIRLSETGYPNLFGALVASFRRGRKGMVPAAEVERLKKLVEDLSEPFDAVIDRACASERAAQLQLRKHYVAEAVKAERERCARATERESYSAWCRGTCEAIRRLILNPPEKGGGENE